MLSKKPGCTICSKEKANFLRQTLAKISERKTTFWDKGGIINAHITYPPLAVSALGRFLHRVPLFVNQLLYIIHFFVIILLPLSFYFKQHSGCLPKVCMNNLIYFLPLTLFQQDHIWTSKCYPIMKSFRAAYSEG